MNERKKQILFRLSDSEYESLLKDVARSGLSREDFIRFALQHVTFKEMPSLDFHSILKHLNQINNNLNQIAMKANACGFIDAKAYRENYSHLQEQIGVIIRGLY